MSKDKRIIGRLGNGGFVFAPPTTPRPDPPVPHNSKPIPLAREGGELMSGVSSKELQAWMAKWCTCRVVVHDPVRSVCEARELLGLRCDANVGRPDCPALAEMPKVKMQSAELAEILATIHDKLCDEDMGPEDWQDFSECELPRIADRMSRIIEMPKEEAR